MKAKPVFQFSAIGNKTPRAVLEANVISLGGLCESGVN
jgi:hypothetical protein